MLHCFMVQDQARIGSILASEKDFTLGKRERFPMHSREHGLLQKRLISFFKKIQVFGSEQPLLISVITTQI